MLIMLLFVGGMQNADAIFPPSAIFGYPGSGHSGCGGTASPVREMVPTKHGMISNPLLQQA